MRPSSCSAISPRPRSSQGSRRTNAGAKPASFRENPSTRTLSSLLLCAERFRGLREELLDLEGLRHVVARAHVDALHDVPRRVAAGEEDDGDAAQLRLALQLAGER